MKELQASFLEKVSIMRAGLTAYPFRNSAGLLLAAENVIQGKERVANPDALPYFMIGVGIALFTTVLTDMRLTGQRIARERKGVR